jgi:hypothetical protein
MNSIRIAALAVLLAASAAVQAETIVEWELAGAPGSQASTAASGAAAQVTGSALVRGAGLVGNAAANSINASGWNGQATDYFSFGFAVTDGHLVDLDSLYIGTRASGTGPGTLGLFYSGDGFSTSLATFDQAPGGSFLNSVVDLDALPDLSGNVEFRLRQIGTAAANGGATGGAGTFRVTGYFVAGVFDRNAQFTGSVSAIPEPGSNAMLLAGLAAVGVVVRRRRSRPALAD